MPVLIKGIQINSLSLSKDPESGLVKVQGSYQLMSQQDVVLATQSFNGYNDLKLTPSPDLQQRINQVVEGIKNDLEKILGIQEK